MENVWDRQDREKLRDLTMDLLEVYGQVLADHLGLTFYDTYHLSKEMGYHAICTFIDTAYRLKYHGIPSEPESGSVRDFHDLLAEFFSEETVQAPFGHSRIVRCGLANNMLHTLGSPPKFGKIQRDPEQIRLEELELSTAPQEKYWQLHYKLTYQIPNWVVQYSRALWNRLRQRFRNNLVRVGHLLLSRKYMWQLPDIQWVSLDMDLENYLVPVHLEKRLELYGALRAKFLERVSPISGWERATGCSKMPNEFLELLLAFILLKAEPLLFQTECLHHAIDFCEQSLRTMNLKALYSLGGWFRFNNAIISAAARRLGLPIIESQFGGARFFRTERYSITLADFEFAWGDLATIPSKARLNRRSVPRPQFKSSSVKNKRPSGRTHRILYTPMGLSNLFSMENTLSQMAMDMEGHRQWVSDLFRHTEGFLEKSGSILYIKIKGFGYTMLRNHESMLFPRIELGTVPVRYLKTGISFQFFKQMDLHIFCGPSTTFAESLALDIPSICLWNPACLEPRPIYRNLYTELDQAGIIVTNAD